MKRVNLAVTLCAILGLTGQALGHGDVAPQPIDISGLTLLDGEEVYENPYRDGDEYETAIKIGDRAYNQNCARCHGLDAVSGGIAPDLRYLIPGEDDEYFLEKVSLGLSGTASPTCRPLVRFLAMRPSGRSAPGSIPLPKSKRRAVLAGLAALGFAPGALAQTANLKKPIYPDSRDTVGESLEEIQAKGWIKIAVYEDFRPFSYLDQDQLVGIDVEIADVIAKQLDLRLELLPVQADETVDADLRNHIWRGPRIGARSEGSIAVDAVANLMLHIPYDKRLDIRNELAVLFSPYFEDRVTIIRDPEQFESGEFSLFDLESKAVGVELDTLADFYLSSTWGGKLRQGIERFRRPDDGMSALMKGDVAAFMGPLSQIEGALGDQREDYDFNQTALPGLAIDSWVVGAAVRENARDLRWAAGDIIDAIVRNGEMGRIFARYGVTYRSPAA